MTTRIILAAGIVAMCVLPAMAQKTITDDPEAFSKLARLKEARDICFRKKDEYKQAGGRDANFGGVWELPCTKIWQMIAREWDSDERDLDFVRGVAGMK